MGGPLKCDIQAREKESLGQFRYDERLCCPMWQVCLAPTRIIVFFAITFYVSFVIMSNVSVTELGLIAFHSPAQQTSLLNLRINPNHRVSVSLEVKQHRRLTHKSTASSLFQFSATVLINNFVVIMS